MKIYVITKGEYSDYHICAVATDKERADKLAKLFSDEFDDVNVETYESDKYVDLTDRGFQPYCVGFVAGGDTISYVGEVDTFEIEYVKWNCITSAISILICPVFAEYYVCVQARDEEHAKKIAQDLMAEYKYRKFVEGEDLP